MINTIRTLTEIVDNSQEQMENGNRDENAMKTSKGNARSQNHINKNDLAYWNICKAQNSACHIIEPVYMLAI